MKSTIFVKKLNKSGVYKSSLDYEKAFITDDNPKGMFRMVVEPLDCDDDPVIEYTKVPGGYMVSGEGYIIAEGTEKEINEYVKKHFNKRYPNVILEENKELAEA